MRTVSDLRNWLPVIVCGAALLALAGCAAPIDASKARSRAVIESGGIVQPEELRVAEYLGYYEQRFPEPAGALGLTLQPGNPAIPVAGGEAWLQAGVQARSAEAAGIAPLNLALVIDCSGSMATPEKMPYVKASLRSFLHSLAPEDIVSLVTYSDGAQVAVAARRAGDGEWIEEAIARLTPSGSTNLHGGLMLGFRQVEAGYDVRRNNRVILLTDGLANRGVTDPARIAADALAYNERGIYLSTIGLGREFSDELLSKLASQGKGAYHFVDSAAEIEKVFRREAAGLMQKAAEEVSLLVTPGPGVRLLSLTGYDGQPPAGPVQVRLRDMGTGENQVLLIRLAVEGPAPQPLTRVELRYTDLFARRTESQAQAVTLRPLAGGAYDPLAEPAVLRNYAIQRSAEALREIGRLYADRQYRQAWQRAAEAEALLRRTAGLTGDEQLRKDADMMRKYMETLGRWGGAPESSPLPAEPERLRRSDGGPQPTPGAPVLEIE